MTKVLLETNGLGNGDWFRLFVDGVGLDAGHSVNVWTLQYLMEMLEMKGHDISYERKDYDDSYFQ